MSTMLSILKNKKDEAVIYAKRLLAWYHSRKVLVEFDEKWFGGKRVAIIGGANSVLKEPLGAYIDSFDVVVRINKGVEVIEGQKEFVGQRTDVLFHCFYEDRSLGGSPLTLQLWKDKKVGSIVFALNYKHSTGGLPHFLNFLRKTSRKTKFSQVPRELFEKNDQVTTPLTPTTGFVAINTIFNCHPKELYITGITFFKTPNNTSYRQTDKALSDNLEKHHTPEMEYRFVKKLYLDHPEMIKPDSTLQQIFLTN